jgi:hypothetical protein
MPPDYFLPVIHVPARFRGLQQTKILQTGVVNGLDLFKEDGFLPDGIIQDGNSMLSASKQNSWTPERI